MEMPTHRTSKILLQREYEFSQSEIAWPVKTRSYKLKIMENISIDELKKMTVSIIWLFSLWSEDTNFCSPLHRKIMHMKITKNIPRQEKVYHGIEHNFCIDTLNGKIKHKESCYQ